MGEKACFCATHPLEKPQYSGLIDKKQAQNLREYGKSDSEQSVK